MANHRLTTGLNASSLPSATLPTRKKAKLQTPATSNPMATGMVPSGNGMRDASVESLRATERRGYCSEPPKTNHAIRMGRCG